MVNNSNETLDRVFAALSDPTRRQILAHLAEGEAPVTDLAAPFDMSLPAVSKHLKVLERAGLVSRRREGRLHLCRLNADPMKDVADWIEDYTQFWSGRLDALAKFVEGDGSQDHE
ncbi:MAG: metalloregulator ArsR/SmtB family transcription factor [Pseudomonadota bacterium]